MHTHTQRNYSGKGQMSNVPFKIEQMYGEHELDRIKNGKR